MKFRKHWIGLTLLALALGAWSQPRPERGLSEYPRSHSSPPTLPGFQLPGSLGPLVEGLGRDVGLARRRGDVSGLLGAARLLQNLEKIGGQPVPVRDLLEEALQMARDQRDLDALEQVTRLIQDPLQRSNALQLQQEVRDERQASQGKPPCRMIFHNRTGQSGLEIRLNARPLATLAAGQDFEVQGLMAGRQLMDASNSELDWGPRRVFVAPGETFHWKLFR